MSPVKLRPFCSNLKVLAMKNFSNPHDDVIKWKQFFALLALCEGNPPVTGGFPSQKPVTRSFDVFFDLRPNKRLGQQSRGRWFDTSSRSLWRHCNEEFQQSILRLGLCTVRRVKHLFTYVSSVMLYWQTSLSTKIITFIKQWQLISSM